MVVALLEKIQALLLLRKILSRWSRSFTLQVFVHAFVLSVLLRTRGADPLMNDSQLHPPDVEFTQAVNTR
jgi:hypothetical protein